LRCVFFFVKKSLKMPNGVTRVNNLKEDK
jgi:hypothetical protein